MEGGVGLGQGGEAVVGYALCYVYPSPWGRLVLMRMGRYAAQDLTCILKH